jgi:hypothetical protein
MTLKGASFLALSGTLLVAILLAWNLINTIANVMQGLIPAVALVSSLIYTIGAFSLVAFFWVFHKGQS